MSLMHVSFTTIINYQVAYQTILLNMHTPNENPEMPTPKYAHIIHTNVTRSSY